MIVWMRSLVRSALLVVVLVVVGAAPAAADAAGPGDYRSEVTGLEPATSAVSARIRGGDAFLELTVARGHEVVVEGYSGEPYLRFTADGVVQRNRLSSATFLNDDRQAQVEIPADVVAATESGAAPDWERVATGGTYAWHDHRIHWMAAVPPPVGRGERVTGAYDPWRVPISVDGEPVEVQGTLTYAATVSPVPWMVVGVAAAATLARLGRGRGLLAPTAVLAACAAAAVVVGRAEWSATPEGAANPLLWVLALVALGAAAGALATARRAAGAILLLASVAALSGWALLRVQVLVEPVLPTELPFVLDRAVVTLALAASAAAAYLTVTSGLLTLPDLDDDA